MIRIDVRVTTERLLEEIYRHRHNRPTQNELAEAVGCSRVTVWRHANTLESYGYIKIKPGRAKRPPMYQLTPTGMLEVERIGKL